MPEAPQGAPLRAEKSFVWFASAVFIVEIWVLVGVAREAIGLGAAAAAHAVVAALCVLAAVIVHRRNGDSRLPLLLAVTTSAMGAFGASGCLLIAVSVFCRRKATRSFQDWYDALFPEQEERVSERVYDRVKGQLDEESVEPASFADLVRHGSREEKQGVLAIVSKKFKPSFAPILHIALRDQENAVRVQAATAIAIIESNFAERIVSLTSEAEDDAATRLKKAQLYDDYAFTGLLDSERESDNRVKAREGYEAHLESHVDDKDTMLALGRLLLRSRRFEEAAPWLERALGGDDAPLHLAVWYMECLYQLRRFDELRELTQRYQEQSPAQSTALPPPAFGAIRLWAETSP